MAYQLPAPPSTPATQRNQLALWAMITAIANVVVFLTSSITWAFGILVNFGDVWLLSGIAALALGIMAHKRANMMDGVGRGQAITGIVVGAIAIAIFIGTYGCFSLIYRGNI
jgi:hypothetical protein